MGIRQIACVMAMVFSLVWPGACGSGDHSDKLVRNPIDAGTVRLRDAGVGGAATCTAARDAGGVDCGGSAGEIHTCIINAPTKSGMQVAVPKPNINYQTCTPY